MDKIWMKERIHKFFLLIQSRPFIMFILLIVVLSTILRIIAPCFLVLCLIATVTCLAALGRADCLAFMLKTGEFTFGLTRKPKCAGSGSSCSHSSMQSGCDHSSNTPTSSTTSWPFNFAQTVQKIVCASLDFVKGHVHADIDEKGLLADLTDSTMLRVSVCSSKQKDGVKELGKISCVCENHSHACANLLHDDGEVGDVPELEDCSSSSEEEEVCKSVLETSAPAPGCPDDTAFGDTMLQPTAKGSISCEEEDVNSIDKHQILPVEACNQCKRVESREFCAFDPTRKCGCSIERSMYKLDVTDAELQDAANEFYTLEGDVLWSQDDLKQKPDCKGPGKRSVKFSPTSCQICKNGMVPQSSENFSVLPSRACAAAKTFARKPANTKVVYYVEAMRAQENRSEGSAPDMNEDVRIDQELRAIASGSGTKGEESNYMSTAGSFRDFVGSFREFDACWAEYGMAGRSREDDFVSGCCDDHARPCISHSRSRSKVLQTDPLLSKASLTREQEIMDVLWQEYNEERKLRFGDLGKLQKECVHRQRLKAGADSASSSEVLDEGNLAEPIDVRSSEYVMKLNNGTKYANYGRNSTDHYMAKARSYQRRRHFVGFCRLFRELGLKQCMQSSKVDN